MAEWPVRGTSPWDGRLKQYIDGAAAENTSQIEALQESEFPLQWRTSDTEWKVSDTEFSSIYWPCMFPAYKWLSNPIDNIYEFGSTDHAAGAGGIYLATAPHPLAPRTYRGIVFTDTVSGDQTETPSVFARGRDDLVMLYQQRYSSGQSTRLARNLDGTGLNWDRQAEVAISYPPVNDVIPNGNHSGYARKPLRVGGGFATWSMMGGGDGVSTFSRFALSRSNTGLGRWSLDYNSLCVASGGHGLEEFPDAGFNWNGVSMLRWRGQLYAVGTLSGGVAGVVIPLRNNLRGFAGPAQKLVVEGRPSGSLQDVIEDQGQLYAVWSEGEGAARTFHYSQAVLP